MRVWYFVFVVKQKTAYEMRISDWGSDVCSSDLSPGDARRRADGRAFPQRASGLCDHLVRARLAQRGRRVHRVSRRTALAAGEEMTADIAPEQPPRRAGRENFRQLIMLRWLAVSGQLATILIVTLGMGVTLPVLSMVAIIGEIGRAHVLTPVPNAQLVCR